MSSVVVYFDQLVNVGPQASSLVFGGRCRPVEKYEFGHMSRESILW